jgi:hypothetical protein
MAKSPKRGRKATRPTSKPRKRRANPTALTADQGAVPADPGAFGWFEDCVHACWLKDGRDMALLAPSVFHQTQGPRTWIAPVGTLTDGASIPAIFWSVIGGPFEGKYRDAAVNHDYECCVKQNPWEAVHRMFYYGMMARGVEFWRAKLMYFAVYFYGPRWPEPKESAPKRGFTEGDVARAADLFQSDSHVSLDDIEQLTPAKLRTHSVRIPPHIEGAGSLEDTRRIRAVTREGPCLAPTCV